MAQQYPPNVLEPLTQAASDAIFNPKTAVKLKRKYIEVGSTKSAKAKTSGNSGKVGRRHRRKERMHGGGQATHEQKQLMEAQRQAYHAWRAHGAIGPQPG